MAGGTGPGFYPAAGGPPANFPSLDPSGGVLGQFVRWLQLGQIGKQAAGSFDPRSRAGLANIASLFAGGPGDSEYMGGMGGRADAGFDGAMPGQFERYNLPKAVASGQVVMREGNKLGNYPPTMTRQMELADIVKRAHTNPFVRASKEATQSAKGAMDDKMNQLDAARVRAVRAQATRRQVDQRLGSAPMQAHQPYQEHDASLLHGPSVINHPAFIKAMLQRRYQAQLGHNHQN